MLVSNTSPSALNTAAFPVRFKFNTFTFFPSFVNAYPFTIISAASAKGNVSDRGVAAMGLELNWGSDDGIFEVSQDDFLKDTTKIFGYA